MSAGFDITTSTVRPGLESVAVEGELDMATADRFRDELTAAIAGGAAQLLVDLRKCTFIDSTGLGVILHTARKLGEMGSGPLVIVCDNKEIVDLLSLTAIDQTVPVFADRDEAIAHFSSGHPA